MSKRQRITYDSQATEYYGSQGDSSRSFAPRAQVSPRLHGYRKGGLRGKPAKATRAYVKRTILALSEKKHWNDYAANQPISTTSAGNIPYNIKLTPTVSQGSGQGDRIGNMIRVTRANIRGHINALPYNASTNTATSPILVKCWIISLIGGNATTGITGTDFNSFFQLGDSSATWQSNMLDTVFYVNRDKFKVVASKEMLLGFSYNTSVGVQTSTVPNNDAFFSGKFQFNFEKELGLVKYNDTTNTSTNKNLYFIVQPVPSDGSTGLQTPVEIHYAIDLEYSDI